MDKNGNGKTSLAELDLFVLEKYPVLNNKAALMRTYKLTISAEGGGDGDDWVVRDGGMLVGGWYVLVADGCVWSFNLELGARGVPCVS